MPYFGLGSPNASTMRVHADDNASSTAAVAEDVGYNEEKKRSAAAEDYEIPAVAKKIKGLPVIVLNMTQDKNYVKIVESYEESNINTAQKHYHSFWRDMAKGALEEIKKNFRPVDSNGHPIDDETAKKKLQQCFYGRHDRRKQGQKYQNRKVTALSNNDSASEFTSEDDGSEEEASSQKSTDTSSMTSQSDDEDVGKSQDKEIITADDTSAQNPSDASSMTSQPKDDAESRSEDDGSISSGPSNDIEQTPRKPRFTEAERLEYIGYFGPDICKFWGKEDDCEWIFKYKKSDIKCVAVKRGCNEKNAIEGVDKLTGFRKITNRAYREGICDKYAKSELGGHFIEKKELCRQSFKMIFDQERGQNDTQHSTHRTVSPSSSPQENVCETERAEFTLKGDELRDHYLVYKNVKENLSAASDDASSKDFYGMLMNCLKTNMINTEQWNKKKGILNTYMKQYEDMKMESEDDIFVRDTILPRLIDDAKEELCS